MKNRNIIDYNIGNRILQRRNELNISLEKLSVDSGIPIADLYRIESGEVNITAVQIFNLSNYFCVPIEFFFEVYNGNINL